MMMTEPRHFNPSLPTLRGQWAEHVSMAKHVSWRAGGVARRTYVPADLDDLAVMLSGLSATEPPTDKKSRSWTVADHLPG